MNPANGADSRLKREFPLWQRAALFCVAYYLCALAGSYLSLSQNYTSFWMPAGLSIAVLLMNPTRDWPWLLLAIFPANFLFDYFQGTRFAVFLCFYFANIIDFFIGAWLVRKFVAECPRLKTLKEFIGLITFGAILNSVLSAAIGAAALAFFGISHSFALLCEVLWGSDVMAVLLLTPFILVWCSPLSDLRKVFNSPQKIAEVVLLLAGLSMFIGYFSTQNGGIFSPDRIFIVPFLLWAGLRFGRYGATAVCLLIAVLLSFFSLQSFSGHGPHPAPGDYIFMLQLILAMAVLISLTPAIVLSEREQAIEREQRARAEYTLQLIASQEAERTRVAGELHDSLGQSLSIIKNHAQLALLSEKLPAETRKQIETISDTTSVAIAEIRRISQDLHPYQLDHLGLTGALNALVESAANASNIDFKKKFDKVDDAFSRDAAASLYRVVQEGVNNIL